MLPRFLLSRGGVPTLQLQRMLVAAPRRSSVMGSSSARVFEGNNAIGRLSVSSGAVRYGSSDAKDFESGKGKKSKKPKKKDYEKDKKGLKAKKDEKYKKKEKEKDEDEEDEVVVMTSEINAEGKTVQDVAKDKAPAEAFGPGGNAVAVANAATGVSAPEVETPKQGSAPIVGEPSEPAPEEVVSKDDVPPAPVAGSTAEPGKETTAGTTVPGASSTFRGTTESVSGKSTKPARKQEVSSERKSPKHVKVVPEDEIELSPRSEETASEKPELPAYTGPIDFYKLIAATPITYANPRHLAVPPTPKGASSPPPPPPSPPPPARSSTSIPPPKIEETHTSHSTPTAFPTTTTTAPKPQPITFASTRLNTPMASKEKELSQGTVMGGVKLHPKPEEPDNCCMSGCVNCVWDLYRESLEYYTAQKLLAQQTLLLQQQLQSHSQSPLSTPPTPTYTRVNQATSMDDDGASMRIDEREWLENEDIPIGIRAFMATEKRLRERRREREITGQ